MRAVRRLGGDNEFRLCLTEQFLDAGIQLLPEVVSRFSIDRRVGLDVRNDEVAAAYLRDRNFKQFKGLVGEDLLQMHADSIDNVWLGADYDDGIVAWINGEEVANLKHDEVFGTHPKGMIGLQVHGIKKGTGPYEVRWRNLKIRELTAAAGKAGK